MKNRGRSVAVSSPVIHVALALVVLGLLWFGAATLAKPVQVVVDGVGDEMVTHRRTVAGLLIDLDLELHQGDRVNPAPASPIRRDMQITVERAQPVRVLVDGQDVLTYSWGETPAEIFLDAGIALDPTDEVLLDGRPLSLDQPIPAPVAVQAERTYNRGFAWRHLTQEPLQLRVHRSLPVTVDEGGLTFTVRTTAETVGEALQEAGILLYLGDRIQPGLGSPISAGLNIFIQRSMPLSVQSDGRLVKTRVQAGTVGDALTEMEIGVSGMDRVSPPLDTPLYDNISIEITRVSEEVAIDEEIVPFETIYEPVIDLPIDTQQEISAGAEGITRNRTRTRYEDGQEVDEILEDTWVAQEPARRIIGYGQRIDPQTVTTPDGEQITYWRRIRMLATSYSASRAGVSPDASYYGRTYTGDVVREGIVAVDPSVIPLRSRVYIPGYGYGDALDTGGAIRARRIDLAYYDENFVSWRKWVDVYLLWPPPPEYQITWVLPNWPRPE